MSPLANREIPKWLRNIQENSWEVELLISGGAIFTLFQFSDFWIDWINTARITVFLSGISVFQILGMICIQLLKLGFSTHLLLRGIWLAFVCVNYVYPDGIKDSKIRWKKPFKSNVEDGDDLQGPILRFDRYSGTVMYLSILSSLFVAGIILAFFSVVTIPGALFGTFSFIEILISLLLYGLGWYILDVITGGLFRKIPYLSYITYPIFKLFDLLTLRFIYQQSSFLFFTNVNRWKFAAVTTIYFSLAIVLTYFALYRSLQWPNLLDGRSYKFQMADNPRLGYQYYRDQHEEQTNAFCYIPSKIIENNFLDVFIRYDGWMEEFFEKVDPNTAHFLADFIEVRINDSIYNQVEWFPYWNERIDHIGMNALIPIEHLENGKHILTLGCNTALSQKLNQDCLYQITIVFWKDVQKD